MYLEKEIEIGLLKTKIISINRHVEFNKRIENDRNYERLKNILEMLVYRQKKDMEIENYTDREFKIFMKNYINREA